MPHRIAVAADLSITRKGIATMLAQDPRLQVVAELETGPQTIAACQELQPDVLILALRGPQKSNLAVTHLVAEGPHLPRILVLGERGDATSAHAAIDAGAAGYLPASVSDDELCASVHRVLAGERLMHPHDDQPTASRFELGPQERLILSKVAEGLPNKAIAREQGISVRTVGSHLQHIFRKLDVSNRTEAVTRARQQGLLQNE